MTPTALTLGTRLGPFEILSSLGEGGMGAVYRARDTKLGREVAIKVLLPAVANDPERLARFQREAQALASLNHPNIAAIYGLEDADGTKALVLELVEGPTLADRIAQGPIPLDEALPIAKQIAEALEAAHEQGIIHRDLKPANIKVRADGTVKVLDFGLAKAMEPASALHASAGQAPVLSMSPTITTPAMTQAGVILGTAAYMSPEQAKGRIVDKRSDLWAFGAVLFEMVTGRRPFGGDDVSDTLAHILMKDPDWTALPANTPTALYRLLRRCLEKDRRKRLADAADARLEIEETLATPAADALTQRSVTGSPTRSNALPWTVAGAGVLLALAAVAFASMSIGTAQQSPLYATLTAPAGFVLGDDYLGVSSLPTRAPMVFTPDGRSIIIQAARDGRPQLFLRPLERPDARPVAGTDGAWMPFVSPDGRWVGFWAAGELRKVPIEGGAPTSLCPLAFSPNGAVWTGEDVIVFGDAVTHRIMRVPAAGGAPTPVTGEPKAERQHVAPFLLPDGTHFLFSDVSERNTVNDARVMVQSLDGGDSRALMDRATVGRLLPSGQLAFMREGTLMVVGFDVARAVVTGEPVPAMSGVMQSGLIGKTGLEHPGAGLFAVSNLGALAAVRGGLVGANPNAMQWALADGTLSAAESAAGAPAGLRQQIRISPDGSRAAVAVVTPLRRELWLMDWTRDVWSRCADCGDAFRAEWAPDGRRLLLAKGDTLVVHALDNSSSDHDVVVEAGQSLSPGPWLADGRIVYQVAPVADPNRSAIKVLDSGSSSGRVVVPLGVGMEPAVSPDGRWLAYQTTAAGQPSNVVVEPLEGPGPRTQVSAGGGENPAWSADGRSLYYLTGTSLSGAVLSVADIVTSNGQLTAGRPRALFRLAGRQSCSIRRCYDVAPNGPRFLFRTPGVRESVTQMDLVLSWTTTLPKGR